MAVRPTIASSPVTVIAMLVSTFLSTSTLFGSSVNPMCVRATTASFVERSWVDSSWALAIGSLKVRPGMLLGSS